MIEGERQTTISVPKYGPQTMPLDAESLKKLLLQNISVRSDLRISDDNVLV